MARKASKKKTVTRSRRRGERRAHQLSPQTARSAELLRQQGFTQTEARVLLALYGENPITGYRVSQTTGIGPAGVYLALDSLVERGVVAQHDAVPRSYVPIPAGELTSLLARGHEKTLARLRSTLERQESPVRTEAILTFRGHDAILGRVGRLLEEAREEVYLALAEEDFHELRDAIRLAVRRRRRVRLLGLGEYARDLAYAVGHPLAGDLAADQGMRRLAYVVDRQEAGHGVVTSEHPEEAHVLTSRDRLFVDLVRDGLRHEMLALLALRPTELGRSVAEERLMERILSD